MSKLRQHVEPPDGDLRSPPERDLRAYVVFTQLREGQPHVYAGWLDAADDEMAIEFAREHYGRDQECVSLWVAPRQFVAGMRVNEEASTEEVPEREYRVFVQPVAGDAHASAGTVRATCAATALEIARRTIPSVPGAADLHNLWAIPCDEIIATADDEIIWPLSDQSYRLARGYSKSVRDKWEQIREERALREYEKDDLQDAF